MARQYVSRRYSLTRCLAWALVVLTSLPSMPSLASLPANYQTWTFQEKRDFIWEKKILPAEYTTLPPLRNPGLPAILDLFDPYFLIQSFTWQSDEMPRGRLKLIHTYGSVALADLVISGAPHYSGILAEGGEGLVRLSLATDPAPPASFTPGMALKFFVSGRASVNLHVMEKLEGQGNDHNFFAHSFSNNLPPPVTAKTKLLAGIFGLVKKSPGHLSVSDLALADANGHVADHPSWPWQLIFKPVMGNLINPHSGNDFRVDLATVPANSVLYEVWAKDSAVAPAVLIGHLVTRSRFAASSYGDRILFFQHNSEGEDR